MKNKPTPNTYAPLIDAVFDVDIRAVRSLIKAGANLEDKDSDGDTPLLISLLYGHAGIAIALVKAGARINVKGGSGKTPLHIASRRGWTDIVKLLIKSGARLEAKSEDGETALHDASENGHVETVRLLLNSGANARVRVQGCWRPVDLADQGAVGNLEHDIWRRSDFFRTTELLQAAA